MSWTRVYPNSHGVVESICRVRLRRERFDGKRISRDENGVKTYHQCRNCPRRSSHHVDGEHHQLCSVKCSLVFIFSNLLDSQMIPAVLRIESGRLLRHLRSRWSTWSGWKPLEWKGTGLFWFRFIGETSGLNLYGIFHIGLPLQEI